MKIRFDKYQGTGNDFVILDNRDGSYNGLTKAQVAFICDRRFGIGADGLMLLNLREGYDFEMVYFNADGGESTMCGNGARCLVQFAKNKGILRTSYRFIAIDGEHEAEIDKDEVVSLKMKDVSSVRHHDGDFILDTGSPHYIHMMENVKDLNVFKKGRDIRYSKDFEKDGINVNFVEQLEDPTSIFVRTYERGVEAETLSCGTGVTAAALVCHHNENGYNHVHVETKGGHLSVEYDKTDDSYTNIWLSGPAEKVFEGSLELNPL
jgi:diaminopimelate epimerase